MAKGSLLKSGMNKSILAIGGLLLVLFLLMIIVAITFIGSSELKEVVCENEDDTYIWNTSESGCTWYNSTGAGNGTSLLYVPVTVDSVSHIETVEAVVLIVLGLLTLVVIVGLFAIVIKAAMGFAKKF